MNLENKKWVGNYRVSGAIFIILIITFITFYPCLKCDFFNWDDPEYVYRNMTIRELNLENLKTIFTTFVSGHYFPLVLLTYSIEYYFFKLNPSVYHTTNIIIHLMNCIFVFYLAFILSSRSVSTAFITSLLFAVHPLKVESLAWVSQRKDVLSCFFYIPSLICYINYMKKGKIYFYYLSLLLFILSLGAKPMSVTLPFVLILYDCIIEKKVNRKTLLEKLPFFTAAIILSVINIIELYLQETERQGHSFNLLNNIVISGYVLIFYLKKTLLPFNLCFFYPYPQNLHEKIPGEYFFYLPLSIIFIIITVIISKYSSKITWGILFFIAAIFPVLQLIPVPGSAIAADRFTYIPSIGLSYVAGETFTWFYRKKKKQIFNIIMIVIITGLITGLSFLSHQRCYVWKNSITLWSEVIEKYPGYMAIPYLQRGNAYLEKEEYVSAISDYNEALKIIPNYPLVYNNRGIAFEKINRPEDAIEDFTKAIEIDPYYTEAYYNRGITYTYYIKNYDKGLLDFTKTIDLEPAHREAYFHRGVVYYSKGEKESALPDFTKAIEINPYYGEAYYNRALIYYMDKNYENAWKDVKKMEQLNYRIDPNFLKALRNASGIKE